ncbi:hypothetical protein QNA08_06920 [Chelatococcus sp. SYSU_G07232]|uniref:DUF4169 domain-containing protein n=1 Tax=Chelatococcus albus TaxID=3047466 RepID=A0ABT7AF17_9HYPH|nr:hypothetical protein [Chelatococcus sp. SYSU_G07232]MDJ1157964.1 hypothetical protein [Chelatococcus sp. SYSU_G07232]
MPKDTKDQRKERLAAALRDNLRRRKQQDRGRRAAAHAAGEVTQGTADAGETSATDRERN